MRDDSSITYKDKLNEVQVKHDNVHDVHDVNAS